MTPDDLVRYLDAQSVLSCIAFFFHLIFPADSNQVSPDRRRSAALITFSRKAER
jgi:hypothetical protein